MLFSKSAAMLLWNLLGLPVSLLVIVYQICTCMFVKPCLNQLEKAGHDIKYIKKVVHDCRGFFGSTEVQDDVSEAFG